VRAEGWVFAHVGDEGYVESCAADLARYRRHLNAEHVLFFTDIKKKHRHVYHRPSVGRNKPSAVRTV